VFSEHILIETAEEKNQPTPKQLYEHMINTKYFFMGSRHCIFIVVRQSISLKLDKRHFGRSPHRLFIHFVRNVFPHQNRISFPNAVFCSSCDLLIQPRFNEVFTLIRAPILYIEVEYGFRMARMENVDGVKHRCTKRAWLFVILILAVAGIGAVKGGFKGNSRQAFYDYCQQLFSIVFRTLVRQDEGKRDKLLIVFTLVSIMFSSLFENILTRDITVPMQEEPFESVKDLASAGFYISFQNDYNFFGFDQLCTPNITGQCYSERI
jgi:hypothetical protein